MEKEKLEKQQLYFKKLTEELKELEESNKCTVCKKTMKHPVYIKTCGHYFCDGCVRTNRSKCPECDELFGESDLQDPNFLTAMQPYMKKLKQILGIETADHNETLEPEPPAEPPKNVIVYGNKEYHVNFLPDYHQRLNPKGESKLHQLCRKKKLEEITKLTKNVDINARDFGKWTPLHEAIAKGTPEIVSHLLKHKCLVNVPGQNYTTPLHHAVSYGVDWDVIKLLLDHGADKYSLDKAGSVPAHYASKELQHRILGYKVPETRWQYEVFLPKMVSVYCHSIDDDERKKLVDCANINVSLTFDIKKPPTHLVIKKTHKLSLKILHAMLEGLQIITQDSIDDFVQDNYFIDIPNYQFINDKCVNAGIRTAMMSALLCLPKLFDDINFYIEGHATPVKIQALQVDKAFLVKVIQAGGGIVLHRPPTPSTSVDHVRPYFAPRSFRCSNFIIYEENKKSRDEIVYRMPNLQHQTSKWLIDCIIAYKILV